MRQWYADNNGMFCYVVLRCDDIIRQYWCIGGVYASMNAACGWD